MSESSSRQVLQSERSPGYLPFPRPEIRDGGAQVAASIDFWDQPPCWSVLLDLVIGGISRKLLLAGAGWLAWLAQAPVARQRLRWGHGLSAGQERRPGRRF